MTSNSQPQASELRNKISTNLELIQTSLNHYLAGNDLHELEIILTRLGRGGKLPHWYEGLTKQSLPNYDGKTIGSIVEMMLLATIERKIFNGIPNLPELC